jgi:hypothetical protein
MISFSSYTWKNVILQKYQIIMSHTKKTSFVVLFIIVCDRVIAAREAVQHLTI